MNITETMLIEGIEKNTPIHGTILCGVLRDDSITGGLADVALPITQLEIANSIVIPIDFQITIHFNHADIPIGYWSSAIHAISQCKKQMENKIREAIKK